MNHAAHSFCALVCCLHLQRELADLRASLHGTQGDVAEREQRLAALQVLFARPWMD